MEITTEICRGILVVKISGEFDMHSTDNFKSIIDDYLVQANLKDIVINMTKLTFIDSSGIGALLGRYKKVSGMGGKLVLCAVAEPVKKILRLSGLLEIINLYEDEAAALACL